MHGFREAVQDRIASLLDRIDELKQKQYPTPASIALLEAVESILMEIPRKLEAYDERFAAVQGESRLSHGHLSLLLSNLHELMFIINETSRAKTPAALISSLRATVRAQTGTHVELLIRPDSQGIRYAYEDLGKWIRQVLREAGDFVDAPDEGFPASLADGVVVLSYPAAERNNVILHGIFLHEIGHHITERAGVLQRITSTYPPEQWRTEPTEWGNWIWEFAADLAAIRLAGPAYLFGIYQSMLATEVLYMPSETHPPPWVRVRVMIDDLRQANFFAEDCVPPAVLAQIEKWEEDLGAAERRFRIQLAASAEFLEFFTRIEEILPRLAAEVCAAMPDAFTAEMYRCECPKLGAQLRQLMPLNEWYDPETDTWPIARFAGILNTGWNFVIGELEGFYAEVKVDDRQEQEQLRRRVFDLIAKSVEFAQLRRDVEDTRRPPLEGEEAA